MRKLFKTGLLGILLSVTHAFAGTVNVADSFVGSTAMNAVIEAKQFKILPLGSWRPGDKLAIQVGARNAVFNDITACILTEDEARNYQPRGGCRGHVRTMTPFMLQWQIEVESKHFLVLDNSYANLIRKTVGVNVKYQRMLTSQDVSRLAAPFENIRAMIANTFENADFDINVKPCGESNAYSDRRTGDITICSEIMSDLLRNPGSHGALTGTIFHEYGHSLLNRWGEPGSSEEDMADQFATVSLLRGGDKGREQLLQWIQFWTQQDSRAEAQTQLQRNSTHSLSIQRARNIQNAMNFPEEISRRWNKMLYRHMTRQALEKIISQPKRMDDIDLAKEALLAK